MNDIVINLFNKKMIEFNQEIIINSNIKTIM